MKLFRLYLSCLLFLIGADTLYSQTPILFGLTGEGGINNQGTIIKINGNGSGFSTVHLFDITTGYHPVGSLLYSNGLLFGITAHGSQNNYGNIFSFDPHTNQYTVLYNFDSSTGSFAYYDNLPTLLTRPDGKLYGATSSGGLYDLGVLFSYEVATGTFNILFSFNPFYSGTPFGSVIDPGDSGKLYGLAYSVPQIYSYSINTDSFTTEIDMAGFCNDGVGSFVELGNKLFGVGGSNCTGFIFSYDPVSGSYNHIHQFSGPDGGIPTGKLTIVNSELFGTAEGDGIDSRGVVFKMDTLGTFTKLFDFPMYVPDSVSGEHPNALMKAANGKLYGTTRWGGINNCGVIFSFNPITNQYQKLHDFSGTDGMLPIGELTEIDSTVGIPPLNKPSFSIYPNPVSTQFLVSFSSPLRVESKIVFQDILGQELKNNILPVRTSHQLLDISEFAEGFYFLTLQTEGESFTRILMKQ